MRILMPRPEQFSPDPESPAPQEIWEWVHHPVTALLVARLRQKAYRLGSNDSKDDATLIQEARKAQGVESALEEIQRIAKQAKEE